MSSEAFEKWIDSVASGAASMSQRSVKWSDANGGIEKLIEIAKRRGVHLVRLTDDKGNQLLAASREPFDTLC